MKSRWIVIIAVVLAGVGIVALLGNRAKATAAEKETKISGDIPVQTVPVESKRLETRFTRTGTTEAINDVVVVSETSGRVLKVKAEVGDKLSRGSVLVDIDDELKVAGFRAAEVSYEKAKRDLSRFETLAGQKSATDSEVEGIRLAYKSAEAQYLTARRQVEDTKIKTPISGTVTARLVNVGTTVAPGTPIVEIVDISRLKVILNLSEKEAYALKAGDRVTVRLDVYPGKDFTGEIMSIGAKADEAHNFPIEVRLNNSDETPIRAGLFARVYFASQAEHDVMTIPRQALIGSVRDPRVFVVENGVARLRTITVGEELGDLLEVRDGLRTGENVVTLGLNNLTDGAAVTLVK